MNWFRFYNEVLDDPKVQKLSPELFKFWVNILCIASKNDGKLPPISDIAYHTRASQEATVCHVDALLEARLIHERTNQHGTWLAPYAWHKRQYKSDTSTERVKRFRNAQRNKEVTPPDTDTDTDTEQIKKYIKKFEEFWNLYGIKKGRAKCEAKYKILLRDGVKHEDILDGVASYQEECIKNNTDKRYIKNPLTFLNGCHWEDEYDKELSPEEKLAQIQKNLEG